MKKYIQACELGGSIYGKRKMTNRKRHVEQKATAKGNVVAAYNDFYKSQVMALKRVIGHNETR